MADLSQRMARMTLNGNNNNNNNNNNHNNNGEFSSKITNNLICTYSYLKRSQHHTVVIGDHPPHLVEDWKNVKFENREKYNEQNAKSIPNKPIESDQKAFAVPFMEDVETVLKRFGKSIHEYDIITDRNNLRKLNGFVTKDDYSYESVKYKSHQTIFFFFLLIIFGCGCVDCLRFFFFFNKTANFFFFFFIVSN